MKDRFMELARKDGYIDSIFNYCDRWCEKCAFTSKCRNYAFGEGEGGENEDDTFEYLDNVFKTTMMMLDDMMKEMDIDPSEINSIDLPDLPDPEKHPLSKRVTALSMKMHDWLKKNEPRNMPIFNSDENGKKRFNDSLDVIYWYNFFISAKIARALLGIDPDQDEDLIQNDSNGSAKIALIGIDRLIGAWSVLMENMKNNEDEILDFLVELAALRKSTEELFPNAGKFIRPGFDQPDC